MDISAPYWYLLSLFIFSSTRSPHIQARPQFKDLHFSKQLSLFGGEETDSEYSLQTANLHTASLWKGLFPQAGRGIKKDRGLRQADSTLHHAQQRPQQKPSEKLRLAIHLDCILHASSPQVCKGRHLTVLQTCMG